MLYLITIWDNKKPLFKIGRTFSNIKTRHPNLNFKIHKTWISTHQIIWVIENEVLHQFQSYRQIGSIGISGRTECFSQKLPLEIVISFIDKKISSQASNALLEGSETTGEVKSS